jgi:hypothetical protein
LARREAELASLAQLEHTSQAAEASLHRLAALYFVPIESDAKFRYQRNLLVSAVVTLCRV